MTVGIQTFGYRLMKVLLCFRLYDQIAAGRPAPKVSSYAKVQHRCPQPIGWEMLHARLCVCQQKCECAWSRYFL